MGGAATRILAGDVSFKLRHYPHLGCLTWEQNEEHTAGRLKNGEQGHDGLCSRHCGAYLDHGIRRFAWRAVGGGAARDVILRWGWVAGAAWTLPPPLATVPGVEEGSRHEFAPAASVGFVHLRVHSAYSLLEGALPIKTLAELAEADRMPALGIADTGNLFGALEFAEKMVEKGIQPIIGCQVAVDFDDADEGDAAGRAAPAQPLPISSSSPRARPATGTSSGWSRAPSWRPTPSVAPHLAVRRRSPALADGLIALTGGPGGPIDRAIAAGQTRACRRAARPARGALRRPALCRAAAPRHAGRGGGRAAPHRSRLSPRPAAGRHQRAVLPGARGLRGARRADRHRRRGGDRRRQPPAADRRSTISRSRAEMVALFADLPEAHREHGRDRHARDLLAAHAEADPAALRRGRRTIPSTADARRGGAACARRRATGLDRRLAAHGLAPGLQPRRTIASGSTTSSASSSG